MNSGRLIVSQKKKKSTDHQKRLTAKHYTKILGTYIIEKYVKKLVLNFRPLNMKIRILLCCIKKYRQNMENLKFLYLQLKNGRNCYEFL